ISSYMSRSMVVTMVASASVWLVTSTDMETSMQAVSIRVRPPAPAARVRVEMFMSLYPSIGGALWPQTDRFCKPWGSGSRSEMGDDPVGEPFGNRRLGQRAPILGFRAIEKEDARVGAPENACPRAHIIGQQPVATPAGELVAR